MPNSSQSAATLRTLVSSVIAICLFAALSLAATAKLGVSDVPELPMPDGSGDTPEMVIDLVPNRMSSALNQPTQVKLSSLRGRVVLLDMFWSRCPHCEEHAPHIVEIYNKYKQRGFTVLGLATDRKEVKDDVESVKAFVSKAKINYPVGFISTEVIAYYADSHDHGVPQMMIFGADGKMVKRQVGWNEKISKEVHEAIESALAKLPTVKPGSKAGAKVTVQRTKQG